MELPLRLRSDLPFFSYGLFRPGQLGFLRLKPFVSAIRPETIGARLWIRDGLPIAEKDNMGACFGPS